MSRSCLSISPCSQARQSIPLQSRDPKSSSVLASSTAAATELGREDYHRLALEDIARIGAVQVKDMLVAVSHLTQPHSHATVVNLQAFTTAQRAPGCSRDPTVRAAPVAHRVPVQVNRACVWRHALPQRPDPLHPNDAVVIVIGLAVVDGEAVVEAAGGGEVLPHRAVRTQRPDLSDAGLRGKTAQRRRARGTHWPRCLRPAPAWPMSMVQKGRVRRGGGLSRTTFRCTPCKTPRPAGAPRERPPPRLQTSGSPARRRRSGRPIGAGSAR